MRHTFFLLGFVAMLLTGTVPARRSMSLFNGKDLAGWDVYIGRPYDTVSRKFAGTPMGLNNDSLKVFSVVNEDGKPAMRVKG
jgi:hypothetical protein